jgi:hypothetical protein
MENMRVMNTSKLRKINLAFLRYRYHSVISGPNELFAQLIVLDACGGDGQVRVVFAHIRRPTP